MQVRLSEITHAARHRLAPLTAEVAGYIVWLVTAEALSDSRSVSAERIGVTTAGDVTLAAGELGSALDSERELRRLLASLLALCQTSTPALKGSSERAARGDLEALQSELGAALIPINHAASRRALARLYRETDRARATLGMHEAHAPRTESVRTQRSPAFPATADALEPGGEVPMPSLLQRCATQRDESRAVELQVEFSDVALVFEPEIRSSEPADAEPPPWIEVTARPEPREDTAEARLEPGLSLEPSGARRTTLRSATAADLLEIDVQFARDTERPAPGWPSEWLSQTPSPSAAERALAPVTWTPEISDPGLASELEVDVQTLRVTDPAPSGVTERHRSDLGQLLSRFLSESGSDERITKDLRRLMGLELEAERLCEDEPPRAVGS